MPTADNALVILTKAPEPGQSKTRLVPPLSFDEAAELARALLLDQLQNLAAKEAREAIGHGIRAKRSKSGAVSFELSNREASGATV